MFCLCETTAHAFAPICTRDSDCQDENTACIATYYTELEAFCDWEDCGFCRSGDGLCFRDEDCLNDEQYGEGWRCGEREACSPSREECVEQQRSRCYDANYISTLQTCESDSDCDELSVCSPSRPDECNGDDCQVLENAIGFCNNLYLVCSLYNLCDDKECRYGIIVDSDAPTYNKIDRDEIKRWRLAKQQAQEAGIPFCDGAGTKEESCSSSASSNLVFLGILFLYHRRRA